MDALAVIGVTVGVVEVLCIFIIRGIACVLKQGGGVEGLKIIMGILVDERDWTKTRMVTCPQCVILQNITS